MNRTDDKQSLLPIGSVHGEGSEQEARVEVFPPRARLVVDPKWGRVTPPEAPRSAPPSPRAPLKRKYAYRGFWARSLFRAVDALGGKLYPPKGELPESIDRILVMRPDHLGDVLFSFPALKALRQHFPKARIDLVVGPWARPLLQQSLGKASGAALLEFEAPWLTRPKKSRLGIRAAAALARRLRERTEEIGGPYDLAVDLRGDFQLILAARLAGVRYLVGRGHTGFGFALDAEVPEVQGRHQVENNLALLESAGLGRVETTNPSLKLEKAEIDQARALLRSHGVDGSRILIGIHPGAGTSTKRWGMEKYSELIRRIIADLPVRVVLLGGSEDRPVADDILTAIKEIRLDRRFIDLCGRLPHLRSFMAVAQQCALYIGNDTGPSHIAAALDVPLICLFSGTNEPSEWGPRGSSVVLIRKRIECEGCGLEICGHHSCMRQLDVDAVFQAVRRCV